jgi:hypothetical protein
MRTEARTQLVGHGIVNIGKNDVQRVQSRCRVIGWSVATTVP